MMQVFGTIASRGIKPSPVTVLRIEDRNGQVIYDYEAQQDTETESVMSRRVLDSLTASTMIRMMQSVIIYGTGNPLRSQFCPHGDFAGKTGTTQNHSDGWFIAFNPTLVTGAWVGGPSPAVRFRTMNLGSGSATALPVVGHFWYNTSLNSKTAEITKQRFTPVAAVNAKMGCPLKIPFPPDTLSLILQDSLLRDTILRSGYKYLEEAASIKFGYPMPVKDTIPTEAPIPSPSGNENNQPVPRDSRRGNLQHPPEGK
jgi:penicillin-binding protein 1A